MIKLLNLFKYAPILMILVMGIHKLPAEVVFDPPLILLPQEAAEGETFSAELRITNPESDPLRIDFLISREQWSITPARLELGSGETGSILIRGIMKPRDEPVSLLMISDRDDVPYLYTLSSTPDHTTSAEGGQAVFLFFYSPGCGVCTDFYDSLLPALEKETGIVLLPEKRNIFDPGNYEYLDSLVSERGREIHDFPILIFGDKVFAGEKEVVVGFPDYIRAGGRISSSASEGHLDLDKGSLPDLKWLPVFLAGLLDGINPCAFTSLIFLISYLRLMGKRGSDILKIGGSFTLAVFLTYFLVGLGAFQFIRMADSFTLISEIIRYIMGGGLLVLALLSLVDYKRIRQGRVSESILQLSSENKKRIHKIVRSSSKSTLLSMSSFSAGCLISLYELGCTGQIYLPMLVYMVKQEHWNALGPLALYNIAFILPLVIVFALFYKGSDSVKISELFQRNMGRIKLVTSALFLLMGVFILFF